MSVSAEPGAGRRLQAVAGGKLDPFLSLLLFKRYLAASQVHLPHPDWTNDKLSCLERQGFKTDQAPFQVAHSHFATLAANIVYVIQCTLLTLKLRESDKCYKDIPVHHAWWRYLDVQTRIGKELSVEIFCRTHFPVRCGSRASTIGGPWIVKFAMLMHLRDGRAGLITPPP